MPPSHICSGSYRRGVSSRLNVSTYSKVYSFNGFALQCPVVVSASDFSNQYVETIKAQWNTPIEKHVSESKYIIFFFLHFYTIVLCLRRIFRFYQYDTCIDNNSQKSFGSIQKTKTTIAERPNKALLTRLTGFGAGKSEKSVHWVPIIVTSKN